SSLFLPISPELAGQRLDKALTMLAAEKPEFTLSRVRLQALLAEGHVTLNGKPISDASRKVKEGEIFAVQLPPPEA
ncbi:S4 domain-containing protein, partial [Acinetobacter baumannii]